MKTWCLCLLKRREQTMPRLWSVVIHLLCFGLAIPATAAWAATTPAKALDERFLRAFNANDLEGIVSCYAEDAVIFPPDVFMARGKDAIRRSWEEFLGQFKISQARISDASYLDMGSRSVGWGIVEFTMMPVAGGEAKAMRARFTTVYEKRAGRWVFISDHASFPLAPSEPGKAE
jgi:uncharacterized protein (TIGR02246 family)